ncbi:ChaN family lipoprotein [Leptospira sp. 'Mane']|uniref:ChaN family lipoprotein n=1 Tax=Leptospira sp. 'Mane' TaxID=3387407 RepID=UPI00398B2410
MFHLLKWVGLFGFLALVLPVVAEEEIATFKVWNSKTKSYGNVSEILLQAEGYDVVIWGEEHDDAEGHKAQLDFFKKFTFGFPKVTLSLEMLEKDQQLILDEYVKNIIPERQLLSGSSHWKNFASDYFPLVKHAKESSSFVVCANPPRRYVNAVARKGMNAYSDFSNEVHHWIPEAHTLGQNISPVYQIKLSSMFQVDHSQDPKVSSNMPSPENMILAQFMWDQGMAESISREVYRSGRKVLHLNGRFHSDDEGGVAYRLKKMGHKVLVLSVFPEGKEEEGNFSKLGDFVILTKSR